MKRYFPSNFKSSKTVGRMALD